MIDGSTLDMSAIKDAIDKKNIDFFKQNRGNLKNYFDQHPDNLDPLLLEIMNMASKKNPAQDFYPRVIFFLYDSGVDFSKVEILYQAADILFSRKNDESIKTLLAMLICDVGWHVQRGRQFACYYEHSENSFYQSHNNVLSELFKNKLPTLTKTHELLLELYQAALYSELTTISDKVATFTRPYFVHKNPVFKSYNPNAHHDSKRSLAGTMDVTMMAEVRQRAPADPCIPILAPLNNPHAFSIPFHRQEEPDYTKEQEEAYARSWERERELAKFAKQGEIFLQKDQLIEKKICFMKFFVEQKNMVMLKYLIETTPEIRDKKEIGDELFEIASRLSLGEPTQFGLVISYLAEQFKIERPVASEASSVSSVTSAPKIDNQLKILMSLLQKGKSDPAEKYIKKCPEEIRPLIIAAVKEKVKQTGFDVHLKTYKEMRARQKESSHSSSSKPIAKFS